MKMLLVIAALISTSSFAADDMVAKEKANIEKNIDQRISLLQDEKSCISAVIAREDFKKCREKSEMAQKAKKAEHIDEQIKKLQAEKEKMNSEPKK